MTQSLILAQLDAGAARRLDGSTLTIPYDRRTAFTLADRAAGRNVVQPGAVAIVRTMLGATNAPEAPAGTIRGDFGMSRRHNLVHGSDSVASADREIAVLFAKEDLHDHQLADEAWVYER